MLLQNLGGFDISYAFSRFYFAILCSLRKKMTNPNNVELEAAKFLHKLIQESKDEPTKLATKLYVVSIHLLCCMFSKNSSYSPVLSCTTHDSDFTTYEIQREGELNALSSNIKV